MREQKARHTSGKTAAARGRCVLIPQHLQKNYHSTKKLKSLRALLLMHSNHGTESSRHTKKPVNLKDLGKSIRDKGLFVPSVIGLWGSLGNTKEDFENRLEEHRTRLRMIRDIGSEHVQIIPDLQKRETFTKDIGAWCYRRISEIALNDYGLKTGIIFLNAVPQLKTLSDAVDVGMMSGWPDAR